VKRRHGGYLETSGGIFCDLTSGCRIDGVVKLFSRAAKRAVPNCGCQSGKLGKGETEAS